MAATISQPFVRAWPADYPGMIRLLGLQVSGGWSPTARVFATLLGERDGLYEPLIVHQSSPADRSCAAQFRLLARDVPVREWNAGWRPPPPGGRSPFGRAAALTRRETAVLRAPWVVRDVQADVVYSSQERWDIALAARIAAAKRLPRITHLHYLPGPELGFNAMRALKSADLVITVSEFIRNRAIDAGLPPSRVVTLLNSLHADRDFGPGDRQAARQCLGIPADSLVVGMNARLDPSKCAPDLLRAFATVAGEFKESMLVFVGEGIETAQLKAIAKALALESRVIFAGWRKDARQLLAAYDIFAHPSLEEPFGLAVLEASAAGLPVVAYRDGATPELIVDGETGLLAPPRDIPGLAQRLRALLAGEACRKALGSAGRERVRTHFSPAAAGRSFSELLRQF